MLYLTYLATHRSTSKDVSISQTWHQRPPSTAKRTKDVQGVSGSPISELIVTDVSQVVTSAVVSVMNLRGRIVNVIDLRHCFGNLSHHEIDNQMGGTIEYHNDL